MKYLLSFLFLPILTFSQTKHDNQIIIHGATIKQAVNVFMDARFQIDKYDTAMGFAYTKPFQKNSDIWIFNARVKDSVLILTGKLRSSVSFSKLLFNDRQNAIDESENYLPVEFRGMENSPLMKSWNQMDSIAKSFDLPVTYIKK